MNKFIDKINSKLIKKFALLLAGIVTITALTYFLYFLPATNGTNYLESVFLYTPSDI